jgi:2-polyprenyl-3-methyl-5-hydroxy-6-metoxy-1,4-benzoquinol methylase
MNNQMNRAGMHHPPCDLCQEYNFEPIGARDRRGKSLRTVVCRTCGLVRHWRVPSESELLEFYGHHYRQTYHGEETPSPRRVLRAWNKAAQIHSSLVPWLASGQSMFDIGAGMGCTVKYFERKGLSASGIEPHSGFQHFATNRLRAPVTRNELFTLHYGTRYDCVLLVHVIEHFRSARRALLEIHKLLTPNGKLYVECPDFGRNFRRYNHMFHYAHIHNFTRTTLSALAQACGYQIVSWLEPDDEPNLCVVLSPTAKTVNPYYAIGYAYFC